VCCSVGAVLDWLYEVSSFICKNPSRTAFEHAQDLLSRQQQDPQQMTHSVLQQLQGCLEQQAKLTKQLHKVR
jgi:hypothetical protein